MKITKRFKSILSITAIGLSLSGAAQATLYDRGNGMIYDSVLDITWLQDANYAKTSGYDSDGLMTWGAANTWAQGLNYGGYNDWRLPGFTGVTTCSGYNCNDSELSVMFYDNMAATATDSILTGSNTSNLILIQNLHPSHYWTGVKYAPRPSYGAWGFATRGGSQYNYNTKRALYAWAVRDGDVNPVPVPAAFWLFGTGLLALGGRKWRANS